MIVFFQSYGSRNGMILDRLSEVLLELESKCVEEGELVGKEQECCDGLEKVEKNGHLYHGAKYFTCETPPPEDPSESLLSYLLEAVLGKVGKAPKDLPEYVKNLKKRKYKAITDVSHRNVDWDCCALIVENDIVPGQTWGKLTDEKKKKWFDNNCKNAVCNHVTKSGCIHSNGVTHCPESIENCPAMPEVENGEWYCEDKKCFLECNEGLAADGRTTTICSKGSWFPSLTGMTCSPAFVLVTGGLWNSSTVEVWGPGFHKWLPNMLGPRMGHTVENCDSHIVVCGGVPMENRVFFPVPPAVRQCIEMQDDFTWKETPFLHVGRDIDANLDIHGTMYFLGGHSSPGTMEFMSPEGPDNKEWMIKKNFGGYKFKHSCAAKISPTEFIVTGGFFDAKLTVKYNVVTGEVTKLEDMNLCRSGHGCSYIKDDELGIEGIVAGGGYPLCSQEELNKEVSFALTSSCEFYDLKTGKWRQVGDMNKEKRGLDYIYADGAVHAFGGMYRIIDDNPNENIQLNKDGFANIKAFRFGHEVERYDPKTETWSYLPKDPTLTGRNFFGVALISERRFFFGCVRPSAPENGKFNCPTYPDENPEKKCTLECSHGYAPQHHHTITCIEGSWAPALTQMTCKSTRRT